MTIKAVKLISGEELIGEVIHEEIDAENGSVLEVSLRNVLAILIQRDPQSGNLGVGFVPFAPYLGKNKTMDFKGTQLIFCDEVDDQMGNQYNSIFGGLVVPPKQLLVG